MQESSQIKRDNDFEKTFGILKEQKILWAPHMRKRGRHTGPRLPTDRLPAAQATVPWSTLRADPPSRNSARGSHMSALAAEAGLTECRRGLCHGADSPGAERPGGPRGPGRHRGACAPWTEPQALPHDQEPTRVPHGARDGEKAGLAGWRGRQRDSRWLCPGPSPSPRRRPCACGAPPPASRAAGSPTCRTPPGRCRCAEQRLSGRPLPRPCTAATFQALPVPFRPERCHCSTPELTTL